MYVNGVNDIVNRQEIAFRCRGALLDATGLIAWFGEGVETRLSERGKRGWRAPEECADDVGPLGTIDVCAELVFEYTYTNPFATSGFRASLY